MSLLSSIASFANPIKGYLYAGAAVALVATGTTLYVKHDHKEQKIGEQKVIAAQLAADAKEAAHVKKVQDDATTTINDLQLRFAAALATPPKPAVIVRMCTNTPSVSPDAARSGTSPGPSIDAASGSSSGVGSSDQEGTDIAPATEAILKRDGELIAYLQGYIRECQAVGNCGGAQNASP